jgi:phage shock protein PspC (stress-responsive transcriptional regulator)
MSDFIRRLEQDKRILCGVAGYIAKRFGWSPLWTRLLGTLAVIFNPFLGAVVYIVAAMLIKQHRSPY